MKNKIINKDKSPVDNYWPVKHKGIVCLKCGMSSFYATRRCWNCLQPFREDGGHITDEN